MRVTRLRTVLADHDPRPERVGILRAVSAAARAPADVTPLARSLIRMGAKLAARASARSDWALLPGLMRANCFTSMPHAVHQAAGSGPSRAAAETAMRSTRALAVATGRPANRSAIWSRYPASVIPSDRRAWALAAAAAIGVGIFIMHSSAPLVRGKICPCRS